eukprot:CAMPEP_0119477932 /NCGR_PEP_ID=MMETSP1344-20130328/7896_1 /TAXON_ID=236787 /ORGANISM="Florenciella parvula, Strain CCMP2471" /LENGTH=143 /DNA_ID=CAMNT_0007512043 /DNA_START=455 /DNA_END=883 /DNA_ORIENTATION=-
MYHCRTHIQCTPTRSTVPPLYATSSHHPTIPIPTDLPIRVSLSKRILATNALPQLRFRRPYPSARGPGALCGGRGGGGGSGGGVVGFTAGGGGGGGGDGGDKNVAAARSSSQTHLELVAREGSRGPCLPPLKARTNSLCRHVA